MKLYANNKTLDLSTPRIMGILNITPDSFSDSGQFYQLDKALMQVEKMLNAGADIIDIGGESTRPMADEVSVEQELDRIIPLLEAIRQRFDCWVSIDTSKPQVMLESARVGIELINDIRALQVSGTMEIAAQLGLPTCIMHMQGEPRTMQINPQYGNVAEDILNFLQNRTALCLQKGIKAENIIWDVGFGFGKTVKQNYKLLQSLGYFAEQGYPILVGLSRKSMIGAILDKTVEQRAVGSAAAALIAVMNGATILRVHDVSETVDMLKIWQATLQA